MRSRLGLADVGHLDHDRATCDLGPEVDHGSGTPAGMPDCVRRQLARDEHDVIEHGRDLADGLQGPAGLTWGGGIAGETYVQDFGANGQYTLGLPNSPMLTRINPAR